MISSKKKMEKFLNITELVILAKAILFNEVKIKSLKDFVSSEIFNSNLTLQSIAILNNIKTNCKFVDIQYFLNNYGDLSETGEPTEVFYNSNDKDSFINQNKNTDRNRIVIDLIEGRKNYVKDIDKYEDKRRRYIDGINKDLGAIITIKGGKITSAQKWLYKYLTAFENDELTGNSETLNFQTNLELFLKHIEPDETEEINFYWWKYNPQHYINGSSLEDCKTYNLLETLLYLNEYNDITINELDLLKIQPVYFFENDEELAKSKELEEWYHYKYGDNNPYISYFIEEFKADQQNNEKNNLFSWKCKITKNKKIEEITRRCY